MIPKNYLALLLTLIPNITKAMHAEPIISSASTSPTESAASSPALESAKKHIEDLRKTREFVFEMLANQKMLTGKAKEEFIAQKWREAKAYDTKTAAQYPEFNS